MTDWRAMSFGVQLGKCRARLAEAEAERDKARADLARCREALGAVTRGRPRFVDGRSVVLVSAVVYAKAQAALAALNETPATSSPAPKADSG